MAYKEHSYLQTDTAGQARNVSNTAHDRQVLQAGLYALGGVVVPAPGTLLALPMWVLRLRVSVDINTKSTYEVSLAALSPKTFEIVIKLTLKKCYK